MEDGSSLLWEKKLMEFGLCQYTHQNDVIMTSYYAIVSVKLFLDGRNKDYRKIPKINPFMYKPLQI